RPVLAAQETDPPGALPRGANEEIGVPVAVLIAGERQVPAEVLALGLLVPPELLAGPRRAGHDDPPHARRRGRGARGDDEAREPVPRDARHRQHPVAEEPVVRSTVPLAEQLAGRARPDGGVPALERAPQLEAGAGGNVGTAVAVDVE